MHHLLTKGLTATADLGLDVQAGYAWVHRAAHILANPDQHTAQEVQQQYQSLLDTMRQETSASDLPRTNNDLEHTSGSVRYHERRAIGRKQTPPGLVIRGAVHMVASVAGQRYLFSGPQLQPCDLMQWRTLRHQVEGCRAARRQQYRFRKAPVEYLAALEEKLCQRTMRS